MAGAAVGGLTALVGPTLVVGRLPYTEIVFLSAFYLGIPITLGSLLLLLFPRTRATVLPGIGFAAMACLLISLLGAHHADQLKWEQNDRAREYCETLIPRLDEYHSIHGQYPDSIDEIISQDMPLPSVYLKGKFYRNETNGFTFGWFDSPGFPLCSGSTSYNHQRKQWGGCACW